MQACWSRSKQNEVFRDVRPIHYAALGGLALTWGASYALIKVSLAELAPGLLVATRVSLGFLTLAVAVGVQRRALPRERRLWRILALLGIIGIITPYGLITWGELHITSDLAAVLQSSTPLFTVLLAPLLVRDERITARNLAGVLVGLVGVLVLLGLPGGGRGQVGAPMALAGALAILGASLAYALTALVARRTLRGVPPAISAAGQMAVASVVMVPVALVAGPVPARLPSPHVLAALGFLGIVGTGAAYILYYWLIEHVGATRTTTVTYLLPATALLWGAVFLGEAVTLSMVGGLVLILGGVFLVTGQVAAPRLEGGRAVAPSGQVPES